MSTNEKLARLVVDRNRAAVCRRVGICPNGLTPYLKGSQMRADIAMRLARALAVELDWLLDDRQGWPPRWKNYGEEDSESPMDAGGPVSAVA